MKLLNKSKITSNKSLPAILAGSCSAMLLSTSALAADTKQKATDSEITNAVDTSLLFETSVPSYRIDTTVIDGVATLSGTVNNLLAKERAILAAKTTSGVRSVIDEIKVNPPERDDHDLAADVKSALAQDPATDSYQIDVSADNGVVTLQGSLDSWQERELASHVAKGVIGVSDVKDEMTHNYDFDRSDSEISAEVNRAMNIDILLEPMAISAEVNDGVVSLSGTVGSSVEKDRALSKAYVAGVKKVDASDLEVTPWLDIESQKDQVNIIKSDQDIKEAVKDALLYDPRVRSFNPEVEVNSGVVTLTGTVDNLKAKTAAERDARHTVGVWRVNNLLKVRTPETISDTVIKADLDAALGWNAITESYEIDTSVENGVVTLTGTVDSYLEKAEAEDVANRTNGALFVKNKLDVELPELTYYSYSYSPLWSTTPHYTYNKENEMTWPSVTDAEIVEEVEDELFWSPFVDSDDISIKSENGNVTLKGSVDDWSEYNSAVENAYEGGARVVENNLMIK